MSFNSTEQLDFSGRVAIVTGGGTGLGSYMARGLANNGAKVYITGRRSDVLKKMAESFQGAGSIILCVNNMVIHSKSSDSVGYFSQGKLPYELESFEGWNYMFKLNTFAPFFVTTAFMDLLIKGSVGERKKTSVVAYPFTKRALEQISTYMAADLVQRKIPVRVVALAPGLFSSEMVENVPAFDQFKTKALPNFLSPVPLLRWGNPEELALSANYLVANEYVNGVVLPVDGGFSLVNL
ncbi:NAD(P)-binding protein [Gymnopus androsaceus JB14]|uniref:NAD(P)-binding protein n=1 Tax=Gymnopus androsaceus JB14 TaxID=1447944 RepID=A0A6A4INW5_9AGAR|nr:NAD(P)-binding protein [Gymnopus androsaceus JB14]